jgi:pyrroloquinoline quinone (PQQ) biosynthesis protein C
MRDEFWKSLDERRSIWDVVRHPFYRRWADGDLGPQELAFYVSEYDHAVVAIADASKHAASLGGALVPQAEDEGVRLWRAFARKAGWGGSGCWTYAEDPLPETIACVRVWAGDGARDLPLHLITLYAIESAQALISPVKLAGLLEHYGFTEGPATAYFRLHSDRDSDRAELIRSALDSCANMLDEEFLLAQADAVHRAHWRLLDGVFESTTACLQQH